MEEKTLIDESFDAVLLFFQSYGWYVVFSFLSLYMMRNWILKKSNDYSLYRANDPKRREVLDADAKRVRLLQTHRSLKEE